jgi:mannose-6-phosphate isomerase-like protein (cupin superfamily)
MEENSKNYIRVYKQDQCKDIKILIHFPLEKAEKVQRTYGVVYRLSPAEARLKNLQVLLIVVNPGKRTSRHHRSMEEVFYFLSGSATFLGKKQRFFVSRYDIVIVPPNEIHLHT